MGMLYNANFAAIFALLSSVFYLAAALSPWCVPPRRSRFRGTRNTRAQLQTLWRRRRRRRACASSYANFSRALALALAAGSTSP